MKILFFSFGAACFFLGFLLGWACRSDYDRRSGGGDVAYTDTVTVVDTIPYRYPVPVDSAVVRYETVRLMVADTARVTVTDTVKVTDSVAVVVPITQRVYSDSLYRAYVSGYRPQLDSIFVYPRTNYITTTVKEKPKRWGIGLQAGYGVGCGGTGPYVGIGVNYNLYNF